MSTIARKHFEAALTSIAKLYKVEGAALRDSFKWYLTREGYIKDSTKDLTERELKAIADKLGKFAWRMENTPPDERPTLDFNKILA